MRRAVSQVGNGFFYHISDWTYLYLSALYKLCQKHFLFPKTYDKFIANNLYYESQKEDPPTDSLEV